ncbi:MAG: type pilus assembly protein PilM [Solirubrobacteraceae bacterium]|jgi:type IV pilus assembly protein PilM|nr:type pilus assembly protein PilM [Solirubrobacteraceae bacterium]MEA2275476.1 type pilus assembly protein PilM [Solirubrobacteraceae bacterium]MEA2357486.1 type pilus assembly protein PilM [Solirubrobacteraceae bacterium]MEA2394445.1 type pilus assembly protein PilM [Solirubrobacteraceae bacterium]
MPKRVKNLVGLDIEPAGISAVEVRVNGQITVERAATAPLEDGIVRDGEITDTEALAEALRGLYREHKGLGKRVRVGVANQKIVVRPIEVPPVSSASELDAAVRFHAQEQLPMPLDQAVLDYQPLRSAEGQPQRVLLVAARREMIEHLLTAVRAAGLRPEGIDLSAFAMVRALYRPSPEDELVLYMSVSGLVNLAIASGRDCLFTRASGRGLEALAIELAERSQLTLEHARSWLTHVGVETPLESIDGDPEIVGAARQVLLEGARRIAADVRSSLDFYAMQGGAASVSRAILTGSAASVPGLASALASELSLPVEVGTVTGAPDNVDAGRITVAAGLAVSEAQS